MRIFIVATVAVLVGGAPVSAASISKLDVNQVQKALTTVLGKLTARQRAALEEMSATQQTAVLKSALAKAKTLTLASSLRVKVSSTSKTRIGKAAIPGNGRKQAKSPFLAWLERNAKGSHYRKAGCPRLNFVVRKNWKDIGWDICPDPVNQATGASISYANDRAGDNTAWTIHGTAAALYNLFSPGSPWYAPYRTTVGAYVSENRLSNSNASQARSNVNSTSYGGVGILAFPTTSDWTNYLRIRFGGTEDYINHTSSAQIIGDWLPVYGPWKIDAPFQPIPTIPITARFEPTLVVRYDKKNGGSNALGINGRNEAFRVGPQLYIKFMPTVGVNDFWSRFNGAFTYHWEYEAYTVSYFRWLEASITFNLDPKGFVGLTLSYQNGHDENTGALTDLWKLSLTGKI